MPRCRACYLREPGVLAFEIALTGVLLFECFFKSLSSCAVHARTARFVVLICKPHVDSCGGAVTTRSRNSSGGSIGCKLRLTARADRAVGHITTLGRCARPLIFTGQATAADDFIESKRIPSWHRSWRFQDRGHPYGFRRHRIGALSYIDPIG